MSEGVSQPPPTWRGRDLLRCSEEPVRRIGLARLRARREAHPAEVSGKTKQEVRDKLQALNAGVKSSSTYTVRDAVDDWLREGLDGTSERTRALYEGLLEPVLEVIAARPAARSERDVRSVLSQLVTRYSTRSLQITPELAGAGDPAC